MPSVSKSQQKLFGLVKAVKAGDVKAGEVSKNVKDIAKSMSTKEIDKFAGTKHKGLPEKKKEVKKDVKKESVIMKKNTEESLRSLIRNVIKETINEADERNFMLTNKGKAFFEFMKEWTSAPDFDVNEAFTDTYVQEFAKFGAHQELAMMLKAGFIKPLDH
jgi:hypothetical protein